MNSETLPFENLRQMPVRGRVIRTPWLRHLITFLLVFGPGLIVMEADNDAGAVSTYVQAGAQYSTRLLWIMFLLLPITYFVQEMVVRLGIATGRGHAAVIYKRFGKWWGRFSLFDLLLVNFLTLVTEFAAISLAATHMGINPILAVPIAATGLIAIVSTGGYLRWERVTICLCLIDLAWLAIALVIQPSFHHVFHDTLVPGVPKTGLTSELVFLIIGIIGTTIAPWQLFFQQSCIADKKLRFKDLKWARLDTFLGAVFTVVVAGCMMVVGGASRSHGFEWVDPAKMAVQLGGVFGPTVKYSILLLMMNAAVLGTTAVSLASSWAYAEVRGWPHSLQMPLNKEPGFYLTYIICTLAAAGLVLIPNAPLQLIILSVQVLAGLILPSAIIFLQLLLNDRDVLGPEWVNKPWNNVINWSIIVVLFALSLLLAAQVMLPQLFPTAAT
jgi:Mn2+/Fe2+ NRAMP family transporter